MIWLSLKPWHMQMDLISSCFCFITVCMQQKSQIHECADEHYGLVTICILKEKKGIFILFTFRDQDKKKVKCQPIEYIGLFIVVPSTVILTEAIHIEGNNIRRIWCERTFFFFWSSTLFACLHNLLLHSTAAKWSIKVDNLLTCNFCLLLFIHWRSIKKKIK